MSRLTKKSSNAFIKYSSKKNKPTSKKISYKPLNLSVSEFRANPPYSHHEVDNNLCYFLNNNPSKDNLNKLYDTTIYFAESDSIGEGWHYVREFTRESFDILCKIMKIDNLQHILINLSEDKNKAEEKLLNDKIIEFTKKYKNRKNISELIKKYRKQLEKDKKHFTYYTELLQYLIDNNILNEKEIQVYKKLRGGLTDYITISFNLLHHLRVL
jgi:hypothetical protein